MSRILFVLRGRPGLGHVIPGYAIAQALKRNGHAVKILTYANGSSFLARSEWEDWDRIDVRSDYVDWPGLDLYDHGVSQVVPTAATFSADAVILGGEYMLAPLADTTRVPWGMLYNPEIFEDKPRNRIAGALFCALFTHCTFLIPIHPVAETAMLEPFLPLALRNLTAGPFPCQPLVSYRQRVHSGGRVVLIANGGGVDFPGRADSYGNPDINPRRWLEETRSMTRASVAGALSATTEEDQVVLFSCLGKDWNDELSQEFRDRVQLEVLEPSIHYHAVLPHADVLVSRAGAGFMADIENASGQVVVWMLTGHDEQTSNASQLCQRWPRALACGSAEELEIAVRRAVTEPRGHRSVQGEPSYWRPVTVARQIVAHATRAAS